VISVLTLDIDELCSGVGNADIANITNILVNCGMITGVPQRTSPGSNLVYDRGSTWSQNIYTCASAVKANIKTVSFNYNGTDDSTLSLAVTSIQDKTYADEASMPLWGVENTGGAFTVQEIDLIWGLISPEYENNPNISTVRQASLYLPGWVNNEFSETNAVANDDTENLPGSDFAVGAISASYCVSPPNSGGSTGCQGSFSGQDYSGSTSMAMWIRWQDLTKSPETAALIPNLIWADTAASMVVGTKGVLGPGNTAQMNLVALQVTPTVQRIKFHLVYAIPAFIALLLLILITLLALLVMCVHGFGLQRMRLHLQQVSPGRIYTTFLFPAPGGMTMPSREWGRHLGRQQLDLSGDFPIAAGIMANAPEKNASARVYERSVSPISDERVAEGEILMSPVYHGDVSQGDIGYGYESRRPVQYQSPYQDVVHPLSTDSRNGRY